jgi:hypothetical protein
MACGGAPPDGASTTTAATTASAPTGAGGFAGAGGAGGAKAGSGGGGGAGGATTGAGGAGGGGRGGGGAGGMGCGRALGPADGPRRVVVSRPYDAAGANANVYEVLSLSAAGELARPGTTVELGRAIGGEIAFTPDGAVAIAVQEDGTLGVVRFEPDGTPAVVHAAFKGSFYAGSVVVMPDGDHALVLDPNWRNNGGGLYRVAIGCDGTLKDEGLVAPAKLAGGLALLAGGRGVLAAADVLASKAGDSAFLLDLGAAAPKLLGGADAFGDENAIVSATVATHDGKFALIGDNNAFGDVPNRVAVVAVQPNGLAATQVLTPLEDPISIAVSPFDDAALVVSGFGNAFFALAYDPANAGAPFSVLGEVAYKGKKPALPASAVTITRGGLTGRVLVAENLGIRSVAFHAGAPIEDLGLYAFGGGTEQITGALGVSP